ncbi:MAG TPA: hypothetical protein VNN22_12900 [Verrucomicrobiae bacterium]|nr:hypothetical protein [Verrucomicrobiae bacterium]
MPETNPCRRVRQLKSSKHQRPSSREIPTPKFQNAAGLLDWSLMFEVSLVLGVWNLEFCRLVSGKLETCNLQL